MKSIRWAIQNNLGKTIDHDWMVEVCEKNDYDCIEVQAIPFSEELPDVPQDGMPTIFYGATNFMEDVSDYVLENYEKV